MASSGTSPTGTWTNVELAGHICEVYEPARLSEQGYVVIYLHGVHLNHLHDKPAFLREFDRHGLRVVCPRTARSWWTVRSETSIISIGHCFTISMVSCSRLNMSSGRVPMSRSLNGSLP